MKRKNGRYERKLYVCLLFQDSIHDHFKFTETCGGQEKFHTVVVAGVVA